MKKAFTLVEMMIVVAVLVTLMSIVFRLSSVGDGQKARATTISRMQRLENCLSGYFAAFGSYPPVKLHGSRNIYLKTNGNGIQDADGDQNQNLWNWKNIGEKEEQEAWAQVSAACRAQPVSIEFPFAKDRYAKMVAAVAKACKKYVDSGEWECTQAEKEKFTALFDDLVTKNSSRHSTLDELDWREIQLFRFGLMSYLLPRYLVMMNSDERFYKSNCKQWCGNNTLPTDAMTGDEFNDWNEVREYKIQGEKSASDYARVANIPSQAVCARWLPNLEGICLCNHSTSVMGIELQDASGSFSLTPSKSIAIYSPDKDSPYQNQYVLDGITVRDGWGSDFYYYSAPPYQNYVLWSSGANGRTFPPWVDRKALTPDQNRCVGKWIEDDVTHLSN